MDTVKVQAKAKRHGHNKKLVGFEVIEAPPHVTRFVTGWEFEDIQIIADVIRLGYKLEIETLYEEVLILEIVSTTDCAIETEQTEQSETGSLKEEQQ